MELKKDMWTTVPCPKAPNVTFVHDIVDPDKYE